MSSCRITGRTSPIRSRWSFSSWRNPRRCALLCFALLCFEKTRGEGHDLTCRPTNKQTSKPTMTIWGKKRFLIYPSLYIIIVDSIQTSPRVCRAETCIPNLKLQFWIGILLLLFYFLFLNHRLTAPTTSPSCSSSGPGCESSDLGVVMLYISGALDGKKLGSNQIN